MASNALKSSAVCWMTSDGSPELGSLKAAEPPTGTWLAAPIDLPLGSGTVVVVDAPGAVVVGAPVVEVGGAVDDVVAVVPPAFTVVDEANTRPKPATAPMSTAVLAAKMPMMAPRDTAPSRAVSEAVKVRAPWDANHVSRAGAPAAPARATGVHANRKTMSDPVK